MKKINLFAVTLLAFVLIFSSHNLSCAANTNSAKSSSQNQNASKSKTQTGKSTGTTTQNNKTSSNTNITPKKANEKPSSNNKDTSSKNNEKSSSATKPTQDSSKSKRVNSTAGTEDENFAESNLTADDWKIEINNKSSDDDFGFIKNSSAGFGFFNNAPLVFSVSFALIALAVAGITIFSVLYIKNSPVKFQKKPSNKKYKAAHFRIF